MKSPVGVAALSGAIALALAAGGCHPHAAAPPPAAPAPLPPSFTASRIRSFSDSLAVTAIADSPSTLFLGTSRGLVRWDGGRYTLLTQKDGLPADRVAAVAVDAQGGVWLATAKGLSRGLRGVWTNYPVAPVGDFLTGLVADGKLIWAGGPEGLGRLRAGRWDHYFSELGVTALVTGYGNSVWVGTSGAGVLRIARGGEHVEHYGPAQGCETEVVRGMVAFDKTLFVVGEGAGGPRAAFFDGERFYSYELSSPAVIEWAARAGARTLFGSGNRIFVVSKGARSATTPIELIPRPSWILNPRVLSLKPDAPASLLDDPPGTAPPRPPPRRKDKDKDEPEPTVPTGPELTVDESPVRLPDGVTTVGGSERGLLVGTRFLGAERIENDVPRRFRIEDLAAGAVRLTLACANAGDGRDDCYLATGGTRAWRFDGQAFDVAPVDPEPDSRVLAVLGDPKGDVLAIHRGANDRQLRMSRVDDGRWTPIAIQAVEVPEGAPDLNFAAFAPDGHLWIGLRYIDKDGDARDWTADEIALDSGRVLAHKELPPDVVAMYWKAPNEAWFATRSGAARLLDGKVRLFTESDGMESDITRGIGPGPTGQIFVATGRGTGRYDGTRWTFPRLGAYYRPANALANDSHGNVFIGTDKGLFCVGQCAPDAIDQGRGLLDDVVADLAVDKRNRVWVLTKKGINIVEP
jgi:hypothetical protein